MASKLNDEYLGGIKLRGEEIGFGSDQMVVCLKCEKSNPPNRANCLYCAVPIAVFVDGPETPKLNLRRLETWENGYNVVVLNSADKAKTDHVSRFFGNDSEDTEWLLGAANSIPIARLEFESDAEIAKESLSRLGLDVRVVSDIALKVGKPNVRARSLEFLPDAVRFMSFNTGESKVTALKDIALIVVGTVTESRSESIEKGRNKGERKSLSESASSSEDLVVDVYSRDGEQGFRITTRGFDFSCLGAEKTMLAGENIGRLIGKIKSLAADAKFVDEYDRIASALSAVWDVDSRKDFEGLKRTGIWQAGFSSVVRTSNAEQFSKYSRLQRILL